MDMFARTGHFRIPASFKGHSYMTELIIRNTQSQGEMSHSNL